MNNLFKSRLTHIVFDLHAPPVTASQIEQWRGTLGKEKRRLAVLDKVALIGFFIPWIWIMCFFFGVIVIWALWPELTIEGLIRFGAVSTACVVFLLMVAFLIKPNKSDLQKTTKALADLSPLDATTEPDKINSLERWCTEDPLLATYQQGWRDQQRLPVAGEYNAIKALVEGAEWRKEHAQKVQQANAAQYALTGVLST